jgi:spore maturation protein CgeB
VGEPGWGSGVKILLIDGTADTSSKDCMDGYLAALKRAGVETFVYAANGRLNVAASYLDYCWRKSERLGEGRPRPTDMDVAYWAGIWSIEMALRTDPDLILVMAGMYFSKLNMQLLRKATYTQSKMALIVVDAPYDDNQAVNVLHLYDAVFVNERASVPMYREYNLNTYYLPACYDPGRHRPDLPVGVDTPRHDVVFVGSAFRERVELLSAVDWSGIDLGLYGNWSGLGSRSKLRQFVRGGPVPNAYAAQLYRASKICLNLYRSRLSDPPVPLPSGMAQSLNPRAYELAACGVFQVSDYRDEVRDLFHAGVPMFTSAAELERCLRMWLEPEREGVRRMLAEEQSRYVEGHTFDARVAQMLDILQQQSAAA